MPLKSGAYVLYLLYLQTFISLINTAHPLTYWHTINIPGLLGNATNPTPIVASAFADDLCILLRNADQLGVFRDLLRIYEKGAGALNSWEKTNGMRVGSLRGDTYLPVGWVDSVEHTTDDTRQGINCHDTVHVVRYLGVFLGAPETVAREWQKRITEKMYARFGRWRERGLPRTRCGRNIVIRNSVFAIAWYMVQSQVHPDLESMMAVWEKAGWQFFAESARSTADIDTHKRPQCTNVQRAVLIQDYPETGRRTQDVVM